MAKLSKHKSHGKPKIAYKSWVDAVDHAVRHSKDQKAAVAIYKCRTCDLYHVGKQPTIRKALN